MKKTRKITHITFAYSSTKWRNWRSSSRVVSVGSFNRPWDSPFNNSLVSTAKWHHWIKDLEWPVLNTIISELISNLTQSRSYRTSEVPLSKDHRTQISLDELVPIIAKQIKRGKSMSTTKRPHLDENWNSEIPACGPLIVQQCPGQKDPSGKRCP